VHFADASGEGPAIRHRVKAIDADAFSQDADEAKVPPSVPGELLSPLYRFPNGKANLRVLEVTEIKTVPYVPLSDLWVANY